VQQWLRSLSMNSPDTDRVQ